ncbi:MAG: GTPase ObgE, partial [Sulfuricurvum sp.]|nr:GTPase ObgE [Sulfuricurvum sp.]
EYQYETLKKELQNFSPLLAERNYAIALPRADAMTPEEAVEKTEQFLKLLNVEAVKKSRFAFSEEYPVYEQESFEKAFYDNTKPAFIAPISSAINLNIKPLTYALYHMVVTERA